MGLSSSQARLLSLTSRQHAVEGEAQRIMANKLRLSNDSDAAYNDYIQALDETQLKVLRNYNKITAKSGWVDASINNLLRYGYTDEFNKGTLYFVQDIETGGLYVPKSLIDKFDPNMEMSEFVAQFEGITYQEIDVNESVKLEFEEVLSKNYDQALGGTEDESLQNLREYNLALSYAEINQTNGNTLQSIIPDKGADGLRRLNQNDSSTVQNFRETINNIVNSSSFGELDLVQQNFLKTILPCFEMMMTTAQGVENSYGTITKMGVDRLNESGLPAGNEYISENGKLSDNQLYDAFMNGGTLTYSTGYLSYGYSHVYLMSPNCGLPYENMQAALNAYNATYGKNCKNMGDALLDLGGKLAGNTPANNSSTSNSPENFLKSIGRTTADVDNFNRYLDAASAYANYVPKFEYVPNLPQRAAYYEEIYKVLKNANGNLIGCDEDRCENPTWVGNMVKNGLVVLSTWDVENEYLSKTSAALNYEIKEVTNEDEIEKIGSEYEETLAEINIKDRRFDKRLAVLESERQAITTEVEGLKQVMDDNIDATFKVFG